MSQQSIIALLRSKVKISGATMRNHPKWHMALIACVVSGCANPVLEVKAPGYSEELSRAPESEPTTMDQAMRKLNHLRARYYEAIRKQTGNTQDATTGLVWLGTALAGLSAGRAHKDAIIYPSLIGGTVYGLTRVQLDARRIRIWTEGIKALDCAKEATQPLLLPQDFLESLKVQAGLLQSSRNELSTATAQLLTTAVANEAQANEVSGLAAAADVALNISAQTLGAAFSVRRAAVGGELSVTVDRVHTKVTEAINEIAVDISAANLLIGGLGGFASNLAPGANLDKQFADLSKTAHADADGKALSGTPMADAKSAFLAAMRNHNTAHQTLSALLKTVDIAPIAAALKQCNVAGISTAIMLDPAAVNFQIGSGATRSIVISGGTPPYVVKVVDGTEGLSRGFSGGLNDEFSVTISDKTPAGAYSIRVTDSGQVKRTITLPVNVTAKAKEQRQKPPKPKNPKADSAPSLDTTNSEKAKGQLLEELRAALMDPPVEVKDFQGVSFKLASAEVTSVGIKIKLSCSKADAALPILLVRERLIASNEKTRAAAKKLIDQKRFDSQFTQLDLSPSGNCIKS